MLTKKRNFRRFVAVAILGLVLVGSVGAHAGNRDSTSAQVCSRDTASGNNRSGSCTFTSGTRRGTWRFSHGQINLATSADSITLGNNASSAVVHIAVSNRVTSTQTMRVPHGTTGRVERMRVAFNRPISTGSITNN